MKKIREWLKYIGVVITIGKEIPKLVEEAEDFYNEIKPEVKAGKEKLAYVLDNVKLAIAEFIDISEDLWAKIANFVAKKVAIIVGLYNDYKKFRHSKEG